MILLQFLYRIHINWWTAHWQALERVISDYVAVDQRRHMIRMIVIPRTELNLFERMALLRLIHCYTPVSVTMFFFNLVDFRLDYVNSNLFPEDVLGFGNLRIGVAVV